MVELAREVLRANRRRARRLGYAGVPDDLPPPPPGRLRSAGEVVDRALAAHVIVSVAFGLDARAAARWLQGLALDRSLTDDESEYLGDTADGIRLADAARRLQREALAVLLWTVGLAPPPDWEDAAPASAFAALPEPGHAPGVEFDDVLLRDPLQLASERDLAACMAWALGDDELSVGFAPGSVEPFVVWERRRALEWVAGEPW
ncbi:MAG: DUF4272 domain-containing protein [Acidimicrobiales bacterium]